MEKLIRSFAISLILCSLFACSTRSGKPRLLVFSKTSGFRHTSITAGKTALIKLGQENGFTVDTTEDAGYFTEDSLKNYSAVIFLNTTMDVLNNYQETDFERYIQAGGGFVGIHSATDTEYDWGWYARLVGANFSNHPKPQQASLNVLDQTHISTKHLPKQWSRMDEWYNFKNLNKDVKVLMTLDEKSYEGGKNGDNHPMAWYHEYDGGRAFYTGLGHTDESYVEENFLKHLLGGIQYAIGDNKELDYGNVKTARVPDEDRFTKTHLAVGQFFEPTELTVLPNLDILITQRRGEILLYKKGDSVMKQAGFLNVYWKTDVKGVNAEEGLLGIKADPNFAKNHYVYAFYSPIDTSVNRLSRFKFENDKIDLKSEKIILQFYSQREICCHTGGSVAFGGDGLLYLSTGDNSTPFNEPKQSYTNQGFAPLDDRPGHEQYDARRSAGNPNDLRGKVLRIRIKEDGSYEIPDGNLYPKNQQGTKPEIYVQGTRNPYRISVDQKNGFLYWGEVGPDANNDSMNTRGPRGYDEVNQARKAGFFGWPLFVGDNYAYRAYDYDAGSSGNLYDPAKPINNSRNNTGLQQLPPAQPAFIWYPYAESSQFPQVGTGGRNAMAGPVYYTDMFPKETRLPDFYNNKLFIYDWIRGWIKAVTLQPNGDFEKMEPFMAGTKFNALIDMEVGPDGKLYLLEYGNGWFSKNPDAALSRIDYNPGNRAPKIESIVVDKTSGSLPFKIIATVNAKDPENSKLAYTWDLGNGVKKETTEPKLEYTFDKAGDYAIAVEVADEEKLALKSGVINVYAGNEAPVVNIAVKGNKSFYFPGKPVEYAINVQDSNDTASVKDMTTLFVSADYIEGRDMAAASQGHQVMTEAMIGKNIMLSLDCKSCHQIDQKSIGPSYTDVAKKYEKDPNAVSYLVNKIIKGGSGVWGEVAMAAHPNLSESDAKQIVSWIQSLTGSGQTQKSLPATGSLAATLNKPIQDNGVLYISASYTDKGGNNIKPLTGNTRITLRNNKLNPARIRTLKNVKNENFEGKRHLLIPKGNGWFAIDSIDLSGINGVDLMVTSQAPLQFGYTFEVRLDAPDGNKIGELVLPVSNATAGRQEKLFTINWPALGDGKFHNLYFVSKLNDPKEKANVGIQWLELKSK
ncbi:MAG: ThuA domain-containing protein [Chitinophagaceae bacterium]|nr:ThuA domain-containing protein [Chitinophagaceae bacterium]